MDVKLPKLGEGAETGTVASILVKVGDQVSEGQTLVEVENEKAVAPVPSPASGRVASLRVKEGDRISIGQVILTLEGSEALAARPAAAVAAVGRAKKAPPRAEPEGESGSEQGLTTESLGMQSPSPEGPTEEPAAPESQLGPAASPSIRKLARDLGIDLTKVRGSERGGRIILADLRIYVQRLQQLAFQPKPATAAAKPVATAESIDFSQWGPISTKPMSSLRRTISRRMAESWSAVPRVTQFDEADITTLDALRAKYTATYEQQGARLTLTMLVLKAVVATLQKHPLFNSSLDEASQEVVFKEYFHIGLAVDTEQGLIVPVIRDVDKKSVLQLCREVSGLAEKARSRKVSLEELKGGTFTISNQGGIGSGHFTPIVNKPEVAILGLGRSAVKPVVRNGQILPRLMLPLTVSYDHRVIDGGSAARFTVDLVTALENLSEQDVKL